MKGHIGTSVRLIDRHQLHMTIIGDLASNSQASANSANDLMDCFISQGMVGHRFLETRILIGRHLESLL